MIHSHFVSIILPVYNEARFISRSIEAILAQDYPVNQMEILIADGMSTDGTRAIINAACSQRPQIKTYILDNPGKIVPIGMNIALRQAKGEIIVRVDGHTIIAPDYVRKCVEHIQRDSVDGVGGFVTSIGETYMAKAIAVGMGSPFGVGNSAMRTTAGKYILADTIPFPAYARQIIERAGFYDEELVRNQDDEYNYRIRKIGGKLLLAGDVRYDYFTRTSLKGLWRQYYQYGYWKIRVLQKHPFQMSLRQFVPPAFVLALITSILLSFFTFIFRLPAFFLSLSSLIPALYLLANLSASLYTAAKHGWKYIFPLSFIFTALHISYGLGFLIGLLKFWNRWGDKTGKTPAWSNETNG